MLISSPTELGALIRDRRKELGLDQAALAAKVGVSRLWVNEIEQGKPRAAVGLVLRTLAALGLGLDATTGAATPAAPAQTPPPGDRPALSEILGRARRGPG